MVDVAVTGALALILGALVLAGVRFVAGPTAVDRVIALDVLTVISLPLMGIIAHLAGRSIYLDVALIYGLLSFIGVLAVARYLDGGLS